MDIIRRLIDQLGSDDEVVRVQAGEFLLQMGSAAVRPLIEELQNHRHRARHLIAATLGCLGDRRAVEPLIRALNDSDKLVRLHAAEALGKLKDRRAIEPLIYALFDEMPPVGTDPLTGDPLTIRAAAARSLGELRAKEALPALKILLRDENRHVRQSVIYALAKIPTEESLIALQEALMEESDPTLRQLLVRSIARMPLVKAQTVLRAIAEGHPDPAVRELALEGMKEATGEADEEEESRAPKKSGAPPSSRSSLGFLWLFVTGMALMVAAFFQRIAWGTAFGVFVALLVLVGIWKWLSRRLAQPSAPDTTSLSSSVRSSE